MTTFNEHRMRFSIRSKLFVGFSILFLILLVIVGITLSELSDTKRFASDLKSKSLPTFNAIQNINIGLYDSEASVLAYLMSGNKKYKADAHVVWQNMNKYRSELDLFSSEWHTVTLVSNWREIQQLLSQLQQVQEKIMLEHGEKQINTIASGSTQNATVSAAVSEMDVLIEKIQGILGSIGTGDNLGLIAQLQGRLLQDLDTLMKGLSLLSFTQWFSLVCAFLISIVVTFLISRSIVNPIQSAIRVAKQITNGDRKLEISVQGNDESADLLASLKIMYDSIMNAEQELKISEKKVVDLFDDLQNRIKEYRLHISSVSSGDLTKMLTISGEDDLSKLGQHLNLMSESLLKITTQIVNATNEISTGLNQLESASTSQAASASQQATSVAEVSSVVEEIRITSRQTLEKASALGESAEKTHQESEKGHVSVVDMSNSMHTLQEKIQKISDTILSLSDKTQQIGEITNVVSDIAKQSKMLALNAAIEAAKAGEAGKGFAVVAAEVKDLAEKSQTSTERVQKILQDIRSTAEHAVMVTEEGTKSVDFSLERAEKLSGVMAVLTEVIQQSSMASQQIIAAVRQESAGIDQIVTSITEIDKVTNQFTSATEQTKSATVNLAHVAQELKKTVRVYKLSEDQKVGNTYAD